MAVELPDDILHLICDAVANDQDEDPQRTFDTLFTCAVSSKRLAVPALTTLYRRQHTAPVKGGGSEALPPPDQLLIIQKWSILWRTIILSCLDKTLFPYCKYVKVLDFRDLNTMFEDDMFRISVSNKFFADDLKRFYRALQTPSKGAGRGRGPLLDRVSMIDAIGEELTQHTAVAEQITGPVLTSALLRWIPRLPRLKSLQLWDGEALDDERVSNLITVHCPSFEDLSIFRWAGEDTDQKLSTFICGLPDHHLKAFETISGTGIGIQSFLALNNHGQSLRKLILYFGPEAVPHLGLLKGCTALETLDITDGSGTANLESTQNDVFLDMIVWLRDCHRLKHLSFNNFRSAAAMLARVLSDENIRLEQLKLDSYLVKEQADFHRALTSQSELTSLHLSGNSDGIFADDRSTFVESLCQLKRLRDLKLVFRSDVVDLLTDPEIIKLAESLTDLEELYTSGYGITDAVLPMISNLHHLRQLAFLAVTNFTLAGLMAFIERLGSGNQDLAFVIDNADPDFALNEQEQARIRDALWAKVGGRFEYQLLRDDDAEDYDDDSD